MPNDTEPNPTNIDSPSLNSSIMVNNEAILEAIDDLQSQEAPNINATARKHNCCASTSSCEGVEGEQRNFTNCGYERARAQGIDMYSSALPAPSAPTSPLPAPYQPTRLGREVGHVRLRDAVVRRCLLRTYLCWNKCCENNMVFRKLLFSESSRIA